MLDLTYNVTGMQGNRLLLKPAFERYFPADYVAFMFGGHDWTESEIVMAVYEFEKMRHPVKKYHVAEVIALLKSFLPERYDRKK